MRRFRLGNDWPRDALPLGAVFARESELVVSGVEHATKAESLAGVAHRCGHEATLLYAGQGKTIVYVRSTL